MTANSDGWSIITLEDARTRKGGIRPLVERIHTVCTRYSVRRSSAEQDSLVSRDVVEQGRLLRRGESLSCEHPFLLRDIPEYTLLSGAHIPTSSILGACCALLTNHTICALGILLLEIILGSTRGNLRNPDDMVFGHDELGMKDLVTARVALINPV